MDLYHSGYDGQFIGDPIESLFGALANYERLLDKSDRICFYCEKKMGDDPGYIVEEITDDHPELGPLKIGIFCDTCKEQGSSLIIDRR